MIRDTLAGNAANAFLLLNPSARLSFQRRVTAGATTASLQSNVTFPYWVRLRAAATPSPLIDRATERPGRPTERR